MSCAIFLIKLSNDIAPKENALKLLIEGFNLEREEFTIVRENFPEEI